MRSALKRQPSVRIAFFMRAIQASGKPVHLIGGADEASELDAKRAINQGMRLAAGI